MLLIAPTRQSSKGLLPWVHASAYWPKTKPTDVRSHVCFPGAKLPRRAHFEFLQLLRRWAAESTKERLINIVKGLLEQTN